MLINELIQTSEGERVFNGLSRCSILRPILHNVFIKSLNKDIDYMFGRFSTENKFEEKTMFVNRISKKQNETKQKTLHYNEKKKNFTHPDIVNDYFLFIIAFSKQFEIDFSSE